MLSSEKVTIDLTPRYDPERNAKQLLFHRAIEIYKLYGGAMGGGKTAAIVNEGIQLNLDHNGNFGLLMRKTWPSFRDTVLPQLEKFLDPRLVIDWNRSEKLITFINLSRLRYGGVGERPSDWEKFMSGEYGWIALDQAEQFTYIEFKMLATRLRLNLPDIRYSFLLSCNPNIGWIKELFIEQNLEDHIFIPALPTDNIRNLPAGYIKRMEAILDPAMAKALLKGDWSAIGSPWDVYPYQEIKDAQKRRLRGTPPIEIGADIARGGDDETDIILREGLWVRIYNQARGHDTMRTTGLIWQCCQEKIIPKWKDRINLIKIKVDADGMGAGVVDRLKEQRAEKEEIYRKAILKLVKEEGRPEPVRDDYRLRIKIVEIHGAGRARDSAKFKNLRAEIHWGLKELLAELDLPDDHELLSQLMALKYKVSSDGRIQIIPKEEIKKELGRSPDLAEGVIYSLADIKPLREPKIW